MNQGNLIKKKIMIVEDEAVNQKVLARLIKSFGYESVLVEDGNKVLEAIREQRPDLILMDVQLVGISGIQITKEIKENKALKSIPVVVVTALATIEDKKKIIKESKCDDYLSKPFSPKELLEKILKFISPPPLC